MLSVLAVALDGIRSALCQSVERRGELPMQTPAPCGADQQRPFADQMDRQRILVAFAVEEGLHSHQACMAYRVQRTTLQVNSAVTKVLASVRSRRCACTATTRKHRPMLLCNLWAGILCPGCPNLSTSVNMRGRHLAVHSVDLHHCHVPQGYKHKKQETQWHVCAQKVTFCPSCHRSPCPSRTDRQSCPSASACWC